MLVFRIHLTGIVLFAMMAAHPQQDDYLVQAETISATVEGGAAFAKLRIERVFAGPHELLGRTFELSTNTSGQSNHGLIAPVPPLRTGDVGIWLVRDLEGSLSLIEQNERFGSIKFPAREGVTRERYPQVRRFAEAIEIVSRKPAAERVDALRGLATNPDGLVSAWAIRSLTNPPSRGVEEFLLDIVDKPATPVRAQIAADEGLSRLRAVAWVDSAQRSRILESWATRPVDEVVQTEVIARLSHASQQGQIDQRRLSTVLKKIIANKAWSIDSRRDAVSEFGELAGQELVAEDSFQYLAELVRTGPESIRTAAAVAIRDSIPFNASRAAVLATIREGMKDEVVARILDDAVAKAK